MIEYSVCKQTQRIKMETDEVYNVSRAMQRYGGSFVQNLGVALSCADDENVAKIKATWPEYWQQYRDMGKNRKVIK